jgi:hypothetical protein
MRIGKATKRPQISGTGVEIAVEEGNGSGNSGGDSKHKTTGGDNPDEGGDGTADIPIYKAARVIDLRIIPGPTSDRGYRPLTIHFTSPIDGDAKFELFKAGEVNREPISFKTRMEGQVLGYSELKGLKKNNRTKYVYYVEEAILGFALEGMVRE